ncbi:MAG: hypothetical protein JWL87_132 [Candidatus Adlerbacteria bacterium]|nr:hypothetical protein [Candidatus Adlerbacteria bacterium]
MLVISPSHLTAHAAGKATPLSTIPNPAAAPQTWSVDRSSLNVPIGVEAMEDIQYDAGDVVTDYVVFNKKLEKNSSAYKPNPDEQKVWDIFAGIAGWDFIDKNIRQYITYKLPSPVLGFVARVNSKNPAFGLAINTNGINFSNAAWKRDISITLVHEYAHLITLNSSQVDYKKINKLKCRKANLYATNGDGCTLTDSYLSAFAQKFWTASAQKAAKDSATTGATDLYYAQNKNSFTTVYAATGPEEDIAEAFTDFVLRAKPTGSLVKDQKILFFYQYPELVKLRDSIRSAIGPYVK